MRGVRHLLARRRRLATVVATVLVSGACVGGLIAYFSGAAAAGSAGGAAATYVGPGSSPTTSGNAGRSITLTWAAATLANGQPVDGYLVTRYEADPPYAPQPVQAGCSGTIAALTCTEYAVPFGSWQYTITPVKGDNWRGLESPKSGAVTIGAASLTLDQSTLGLGDFGGGLSDATLTGSLAGFASDEGISFKLDDPSTGATLGGSPASADADGDASVSITLPRPSDGSHTIYALGDAAYPSQASAAVLVDTTPPTTSASGYDADWHSADVTVALSATDGVGGSGVKNVKYDIDGGSLQTITGSGGDVTVGAPSDHSNDGTHTITFYATDNAGNVESPSNSATVKIDTTKPSTSLTTSPASPDGDNNWFKQPSVDFTLSASDASSGVAASYYTVDGGAPQTYTSTVTIGTQGDHTVTFWSVDDAGNVEDVNTAHVKLDDVKPSTSLVLGPTSPDGAHGWYVSTPSFTLDAADATSGVAATSYDLDGGPTQAYSGAVPIPDGQHAVSYWSLDNAGNEETHHTTATIKVDTADPTGAITSPTGAADVRQTIAVSSDSADATSGVDSALFQRSPHDAGSWTDIGAADTSSPYSVNLNTTLIADGLYDVRVVTTDNAGRSHTSALVTFRVDNTPPTVTPSVAGTLGTNGWYTSNVQVSWSTSDAGSGIDTADGCSTTNVTSDTSGTTFTCTATDKAGNSTSDSVTIKRDATNPSVSSANVTGTLGNNGWYTSNVQVSWPAPTDATSGIASTSGCTTSNQNVDTTGTTFTCSATDNAGNTDSKSVTIKRDANNPTGGSITANGSGAASYNTTGTVSLSKTNYTDATSGIASNAITRAHATLSGDSCGSFSGSDPVTISGGNDSDALTTGCYRYTLTGTDNAGNSATSQSAVVKVDTSPPSAPTLAFATSGSGVYYPGSGSNVFFRPAASSISFTVTASSTDGDTGVASYGFPSVTSWTLSGSGASRTYTYTTGGSTQTNRPVTATNNAGGTSGATTFSVTADSTAPSTTDNTGSIGNAWKTTAQTVTLTPTDGGSGVAATYYTTDGSTPTTSSSQGTSVSLSSDGVYTVKYFSVDRVGNQESVKTAGTQIRIDSTSPTGSITAPSDGGTVSGSSVTVSANSADATSGVASAQFQVASHGGSFSNLGAADTSSPYSVSWNTTSGFPNGDYDLRVITTDNAGNTFTSAAITVTVNNAPLTITSVSRNAGNKKVSFSGTGAAAGTLITVTICTTNSFPCSAANNAGTSTFTPSSAGAWGPSGQSSQNLSNNVTYYAQAVQGSATSAVFSFTVTNL
jgi:hypothetical protein